MTQRLSSKMKLDDKNPTRWKIFLFLFACISGVLFALLYRKYEETVHATFVHTQYFRGIRESGYEAWLQKGRYRQKWLSEEQVSFDAARPSMEASVLRSKVTVFCVILTKTKKKASAVKETWSTHCNKVLFFGTYADKDIPVVKVPRLMTIEGFCLVARFVQKQPDSKKAKWFLITDDDTYSLVENLRYYVAPLNSSHPYYLGHASRVYSRLYNEGEAGIVLSQKAMEMLLDAFVTEECSPRISPSTYYDEGIGVLMQQMGVSPVDTRDMSGKARFISFSPEQRLIPGSISIFSSYWRRSVFLSSEGANCCSDFAITFHGIIPSQMFLMEYLLHHLSAFRNSRQGIGNHPPPVVNTNAIDPKDNMIERGVPHVQLIQDEKPKKPPMRMTEDSGVLSKLWKDFFGNSI